MGDLGEFASGNGVRMLSTVSGGEIEKLSVSHFGKGIECRVEFARALSVVSSFDGVVVEIGGHPILSRYIGETMADAEIIHSLSRPKDGVETENG